MYVVRVISEERRRLFLPIRFCSQSDLRGIANFIVSRVELERRFTASLSIYRILHEAGALERATIKAKLNRGSSRPVYTRRKLVIMAIWPTDQCACGAFTHKLFCGLRKLLR
jgi:hypothetical protein